MRIASELHAGLERSVFCSIWSTLFAIGQRLAAAWTRLKISHRGSFSVERLYAFEEFSRETSASRAALICLLLPLPVFLLVVLIELIPLQDPYSGWQNNYGAWSRLTVTVFLLAVGFIVQANQLMPALGLSKTGVICIALMTSLPVCLVMIGIASAWVYPIPFSQMIAGPLFFTFFVASACVVMGRRRFQENPNLVHDIKRQLDVLNAQGVCAILYVTFSAIYFQLAGNEQTMFVLVLPLLKLAVEQVIARTTTYIAEYIAGIVVFSVEVFNALYVAKCLQNGTSRSTFFVLIAIDIVKMGLTFYHMHRETTELLLMMKSEMAALQDYETVSIVRVVMKSCQQPGALSTREGDPVVLVRSPVDLNLSTGSADLVELIELIQRVHSGQLQPSNLAMALTPQLSTSYPKIAPMTNIQATVTRAAPNSIHEHEDTLKHDQIQSSSMAPRHTISLVTRQIFVHRSMKVLFQCEYHALVEYIEFMIPAAYALYVEILCQLPSASYYPETKSLTTTQRHAIVSNILIYSWLEFLSFVALHFVVKWRFKFSLLHLLAFTLKSRFAELQARLLAAFVYVLPITLVHYGTMSPTPGLKYTAYDDVDFFVYG